MKFLAKLLLLSSLWLPLSASALFDQCKDLFPAQQVPSTTQIGRDLCFDDFAIYYSPSDKKPIYTVERLHGEQLQAPHPRRSNQFYEEARLPAHERALLADYRGSGYDRGHNVPAGDMTRERGMAQSFSLANMMPQTRQNNQGIWAKRVEEPTRMYIKRAEGDVYVFTGSTGNAGSIGKSKVIIPSHLYKLVYDPNKKLAWAYWVENTDDAQMSAPISYAELVQKTGIDFHLPTELSDGATSKPVSRSTSAPRQAIGGWYPVFFDQYSPEKVAAIISNIKAGKVASVQIQYDHNVELAQKLVQEIGAQSTLQATLSQSSPPDSPNVSYERNRVTAIVHSK
ncbi:MAG: endonuclease [Polynucleobacter sp. 24-46-87]|jgi:endonuclease G|uniref:DNA/RNA non-specific endonuclease n=1 Tax=unclassified Polynucleobacter TaxID=2640945 RepID=UPI000BCEB843|nr:MULTISPECIES: DNA/RNA non-specific endonuclease [unclassified Polynucleobacter]OYY21332.1 MAG: endonuclease [Polynucleobacter sp. 35-46-11]OZA16214.1 MAG: endonuclease [Polynucleobacter sp. 24-46-87]OZA76478.1 MAG: endonuclease [Polynucleobacter sp. 39-46-10]